MRVVEVTRFGGPEVLAVREVADPAPADGQVLIDVAAADVLFVDAAIRSGWGSEWFSVTPPYVAGNGVAGTVRAVGPGVDAAWVGRRVLAQTGANGGMSPTGGYAEQAVVVASALVAVPDRLALPEALALLHDGPTVVSILDSAELRPGQRVLITAAGGSLGTLLVPLAKAAGAEVIGAARGARKLDFVREWGADTVVDYTRPGWTSGVGEVDVVLDGAGGDIGGEAFTIVRRGGRLLAYGSPGGDFARIDPAEAERREVRVVGILELGKDLDRQDAVAEMLRRAAAGEVTPLVGQTFPLAEAEAAHRAIAARETVGKTLLLI
jgi:NADPH2:quinone reductase